MDNLNTGSKGDYSNPKGRRVNARTPPGPPTGIVTCWSRRVLDDFGEKLGVVGAILATSMFSTHQWGAGLQVRL
ncbi:MAG: hypothetical protein ACFFCO_11640 [Promethearchaeota archaeon]